MLQVNLQYKNWIFILRLAKDYYCVALQQNLILFASLIIIFLFITVKIL